MRTGWPGQLADKRKVRKVVGLDGYFDGESPNDATEGRNCFVEHEA